jgi:hypothetical protein
MTHAVVVDQEIHIEGNFLEVGIHPDDRGAIREFGLTATVAGMVDEPGILLEGFGSGSRYIPSRRLNAQLEILEQYSEEPVLRYSYDCEGPDISGLHVTRLMEFFVDESSLRVTWTVENRSMGDRWLMPWVRNHTLPGGNVSSQDRMDVPAIAGIMQAQRTTFLPASRNWISVTDPIEQETFYAVFDAEQVHSYLTLKHPDTSKTEACLAFQTAFVPSLLPPGETWQTVYRLNAVRGLAHVDFATDELAAQLDYSTGHLVMLIS